MMTERQLQFRVGLFVLASIAIGIGLVIHFGDVRQYFEQTYVLKVYFNSAAGIYPSAPITLHGLTIGQVRSVKLNEELAGVVVIADIRSQFRLRSDATLQVIRGILGDSTLVVDPGSAEETLLDGATMIGLPPSDPNQFVARLQDRTDELMGIFLETTKEVQQVAAGINVLMTTKRGHLEKIVDRTAESLDEFAAAMQQTNKMLLAANTILADPQTQAALKQTLTTMPRLVEETQKTIVGSRQAIESMHRNLTNLQHVTDPLARRGEQLVARLEGSLTGLDATLSELSRFTRTLNQEDGTVQRLLADPSLYNNLDRSTTSLAVLLRNLEPILQDISEFGDKIARKPELLGVGGAMRPSSGLKDEEVIKQSERVTPASRNVPSRK